MPKVFSNWFFVCLLWLSSTAAMADTIHHELRLRLDPASGVIEVSDRVSLPADMREQPVFALNRGLSPSAQEGKLLLVDDRPLDSLVHYRFQGALPDGYLTLNYRGEIDGSRTRAGHGMPVARVGVDGVYLDGASGWYPLFGEALKTYRLQVDLPAGWTGMSAGKRGAAQANDAWDAGATPQDDIYFLAGPYHAYACRIPQARLQVLLNEDDPTLAHDYLDATARYLALYDDLLGAYPYEHFAVVENRWQTGYGMPSFTLLGSRVMRLPFILDSSLPHEIVHNWWGNGVFLTETGGNWSEGLTAYLADHLIKELAGQGANYRRKALERYANFTASGRDFPLRAFRARHDDASQAVGYSKAMMLFHMLRRELGDKAFMSALRDFFQHDRFTRAGFDQLLTVFGKHGLADRAAFRHHWLDRVGAPELVLEAAAVEGNRLTLRLKQTQAAKPYPLKVPVAVTLAGEARARWLTLSMSGDEAEGLWEFASRPLRVDVDPAFELFRRLLPGERPASLGRLFGSPEQLLVLPGRASAEERSAWRKLAAKWQRRYRNVRVVEDASIDQLPSDVAVWLLGWDNTLVEGLARRFEAAGQVLAPTGADVSGMTVEPDKQAVVLLDADNSRPPLGFIGARGAPAISRLAGKLTHYGSFGRLVFDLPGVGKRLREDLAVPRSPLSRAFTDRPVPLVLPAAVPLTSLLEDPLGWRKVHCR